MKNDDVKAFIVGVFKGEVSSNAFSSRQIMRLYCIFYK